MSASIFPDRLSRWGLRAVVALVLVYLLYLLGGNVFLHLPQAEALISRQPQKFRMQWGGGYTLWPGRVTLRDVHMAGQAQRTAWSVQAGSVHGRVALWPLLRREVRLPWVEAGQLTGHVARVSPLPPAAPAPARNGPAWTLQIDRIHSDSIVGGEVFGWALKGTGSADVGFRKQFRGGPLTLMPSSVAFDELEASVDGMQVLRQTHLDAEFELPEHVSRDYPGLQKLSLLKAALSVSGVTPGLQAVLDADAHYHFDVVPGNGRLEAQLRLDGGMLATDDRLHLRTPLQAFDSAGQTRDNTLDLRLEVDEGLHLRAQLPELADQPMQLDADLRMPGRALPVGEWQARLAQSSGHARAQLRVPSIAAVLALFAQTDWLALEGSGSIDADLRLANGRLESGSRLAVEDVQAQAEVLGNRFRGSARAEAEIVAMPDGQQQSKVELVMASFEAATADAPETVFVEGQDLRVSLLSDAVLERMRETVQAQVRFARARIPDLAALNPYLPNDKLRFRGGSGTLSGDLQVDAAGEVGEGRLRVEGSRTRLTAAGLDLRGDIRIDARLRRGDLQRGQFELGGSRVELRDVAFVERDGTAHSGWWAVLDLEGGRVAWKQPPSAGGRIRARMRDVGFLLALFADRADYPRWIGRVIDDGQARVEGRWAWHSDQLVFDRVHAANDRFQLDARLRLRGESRRGDLYAAWGRLGAAIELHDDTHTLHLRGARAWYEGRPDLLR